MAVSQIKTIIIIENHYQMYQPFRFILQFCSGNTATLTAGGRIHILIWTGPQTSTYNVGTAGTYTVTGTDINGCVNTKTVSLTVNSFNKCDRCIQAALLFAQAVTQP